MISNCWKAPKNLWSSWNWSNRPIWRKKMAWIIDLYLSISKKKKKNKLLSHCRAEWKAMPCASVKKGKVLVQPAEDKHGTVLPERVSTEDSIFSLSSQMPFLGKGNRQLIKPKSPPNHLETNCTWKKKRYSGLFFKAPLFFFWVKPLVFNAGYSWVYSTAAWTM